VRYSIEARYPHQVWEIEVPLRDGRLDTTAHVADLEADFHAAHEELFAVRDPAAPVELVTWRAHVRFSLRRHALGNARPEPSERAIPDRRRAYFAALGSVDVPVRAHDALRPGEVVSGPLIVESPVTTVVLDERAAVELSPLGSLLVDPFAAVNDNAGGDGG
jgi:N-methylhydantoinase A